MGLTTIQDFVVDTLIEKQSITKERLSNALDQILSSEGIDKFLGLLIQEKPVDKKLNKGYLVSRCYGMDNKKIQSYYTEKTDSRYRRLLLLGTFSRRS